MLSLDIKKRDMKVNADKVRTTGFIPAVFYGPKESSTSVLVDTIQFKKIWKKAGSSSVIILKDESGNEHESLIHDVDIHPLTDEPRHADFYVIEKGKKVKVAIPLIFEGVSPAVKDLAGILVKVRRDIDVEAAPRDLPQNIIVNISKLALLSDVILVKDLPVPTGVDIKIGPDEVIASIAVAKEEVEEAPTAIDMSAIEVETKGKEVKEGEEAPVGAGEAGTSGGKKEEKK